ncbi:MAG: hypothetical protein V4508_12910 [Pseudomonadota bacterium]
MSDRAVYAWLNSWEQPFEGSLSLLLKFAWANGASAGDICRDVFGKKTLQAFGANRKGRSLLDLDWPSTKHIDRTGDLKAKCAHASLYTLAGDWTFKIASDTHIRYCEHCLGSGFHSGIYQIDALQRCPIHDSQLLTICRKCGFASPPHAVYKETFLLPFHCPHCENFLGEGGFDPKRWQNKELRKVVEQALAPIADWLKQISTEGRRWNRWDDWGLPLRYFKSSVERRKATVHVLSSIVHPNLDNDVFGRNQVNISLIFGRRVPRELNVVQPVRFDKIRFSDDEIREKQQVYKSIRRQVERRYGRLISVRPDVRRQPWQDYVDHLFRFRPRKRVCLTKLAVLFWRFRMEDYLSDGNDIFLRLEVMYWPQNGTADINAWAGFVIASFHAALAVLSAWSRRAIDLADIDVLGPDQVRARELFAEFAPAFGSEQVPTLPGVSTIEFDIERNQTGIIVFCAPTPIFQKNHLHCSLDPCACLRKAKLYGHLQVADLHR